MSKKIILFFVLVFFFSSFNFVRAEVVINEIKISPIEERFIKLYNQDNFEVDLTNHYIQRKTQTGSNFNSLVSKTYFENKKIKANSYFLISRVLMENSDIVLGDLTLTESNVIQIKNANGEVVDKVCWGEVSDCGEPKILNPPSGQSIKIEQSVSLEAPIVQVSESSSVSISGSELKTKINEVPQIKTKIIAKTFGLVGLPLSLDVITLGLDGEPLGYGKYFWNFGDGDSKEIQVNKSGEFKHTYFYPGDYVVSLDYFSNPYIYKNIPDASSQIIIKVIGADISISRVGDEKDFFVELSNNTDYSIDLSNWFLVSTGKSFTIPRNTILAAKKKMIISPKITNFSIIDRDTLKLMNSEGEVVFEYGVSNSPLEEYPSGGGGQIIHPGASATPQEGNNSEGNSETEIPVVDNLPATVLQSDVSKSDKSNSYLPIFSSIAFIGTSAGAVYFIRRKKVTPKDVDDFEILDE